MAEMTFEKISEFIKNKLIERSKCDIPSPRTHLKKI